MEANNVDRFWCEDARNVRCVREADYDSLSKRLHETLEKHLATLSQLEQKERECEELREKADKFATIERVMEMLACDEREGGVWTACTLLLISSAHQMNSAISTITQEGVTVQGKRLGDWRVTVEQLAKEGASNG